MYERTPPVRYLAFVVFISVWVAQFSETGAVSAECPETVTAPRCHVYCAEPMSVPSEGGSPRAISRRGVKIFVTNDVHGHVFEDAGQGRIGYALLKGMIDSAREEGYDTLLMDAGDAFSGSAVAQFDSGRSVAELMGRMGYRVLAPGNHAFDYNTSENDALYYTKTLIGVVSENSSNPLSVLCLNLALDGGPVPGIASDPLVLIDEDGFRLVVVGVITPYVSTKGNRYGVARYDFGLVQHAGQPEHASTREQIVNRLASVLAPYDLPGDIVVVLSHVGHDDSADYNQGQVSGRDLAAVPNVDFVADAHSHNRVPAEKICAAYYGNAGRYLENVAEITIIREGEDVHGGMEIKDYSQLHSYRPATDILSALRGVSDRMGLGERLFFLEDAGLMNDADINVRSTPLGRFLCRSMAAISGADLAVYNSGGIRAGLPGGWVTVGNVYDMIPFQNNLVTFAMSGRDIEAFFAALPARNTNAFPQFFGMTALTWEDGRDGSLRLAGVLDRDGWPLVPEKTYAVAINTSWVFT